MGPRERLRTLSRATPSGYFTSWGISSTISFNGQ